MTPLRAAALAAGLVTLAFASADRAGSQPAGGAASNGVSECKVCHTKPHEGLQDYLDLKSDQFVKLTESAVWQADDPHAKAFAVLSPEKNPVAARMARAGIDGRNNERCLTCHATDTDPGRTPKAVASFIRSDAIGIGCTACHGRGGNWQTEHYKITSTPDGNRVAWRETPAADKRAAGLADLRHPAARSAMCASCHVGNAAEGKVVTHDMYAAGHPPLPPFEPAAFARAEPPHWGEPLSMPVLTAFAKQHPDKAWDTFRFHPTDDATAITARLVAVGAVAALKAEMDLLAADAADGTKPLVDFARFDCYACHHDLRVPSDRQARGYDGAPGRPPLKAWVGTLPGVVAAHAGGQTETDFASAWAAVKAAAVARPFGDRPKLRENAKAVSKWCGDFIDANRRGERYTPASAKELVAKISAAATDAARPPDPEAAMHLTWAVRALREPADAALAAVVPPTPRGGDRQAKLNEFEFAKFRAAFRAAFP